jgi:hypothetical protein
MLGFVAVRRTFSRLARTTRVVRRFQIKIVSSKRAADLRRDSWRYRRPRDVILASKKLLYRLRDNLSHASVSF